MQRSERLEFLSGGNNSMPIRTVYVVPIKRHMINEVEKYFQQFGAVEAIRFHKKDGYQTKIAFIQFKSTEDAARVLSKDSHRIANWKCKVKAADSWQQPSPLLTPPDQDSPSNILIALNEDCLHEVFRHLNVKILTNAAEVCVRFNAQAKETFARKKMKVDLCRYGNYEQVKWKPSELESLFSNFGASISSLTAYALQFERPETFVRLACKHLTSRLKDLELYGFNITELFTAKLSPLFLTLENLHLNFCALNMSLTSGCNDLKVLKIHHCQFILQHFEQKSMKLEEASFVNNGDLSFGMLNSFIKLNPTVKKLTVHGNRLITSHVIRAIAESLPNLTELDIDEMSFQFPFDNLANNILALSRLRFLKVLKLNFNSVQIAPLMKSLSANNVRIEHLGIKEAEINNDAIDSISKMKDIKILYIQSASLTDENLIERPINLPELQELHLDDLGASQLTIIGLKNILRQANKLSTIELRIPEITISVDDYKAILKTVLSRPEKVKLSVKVYLGHRYKVNVPKDILELNRDILRIDCEYLLLL